MQVEGTKHRHLFKNSHKTRIEEVPFKLFSLRRKDCRYMTPDICIFFPKGAIGREIRQIEDSTEGGREGRREEERRFFVTDLDYNAF